VEHQLQNEFRIAAIVLMSPARATTNLRGITQPDFATEFFQQSFEPGTITAGFEPNDHLASKLRIESAYFCFALVFKFVEDKLSALRCQITNRLLSCMKVNADIYSFHSASFQSQCLRAECEFTTRGGRLFHNIKSQDLRSQNLRSHSISDLDDYYQDQPTVRSKI